MIHNKFKRLIISYLSYLYYSFLLLSFFNFEHFFTDILIFYELINIIYLFKT